MNFTGSDWCGWCIRLKDEVFSQDEFKTGVKDEYVLVELDFPQDDKLVTAEEKKQNAELSEKFGVQGFPTILLADEAGRPYAATGYQEGGAEKYLEHLKELQAKKTARDEAFAAAEKAEGVDKAEALVKALDAMSLSDEIIAASYGEVVKQITAADPDDKTGYGKRQATKERLSKFEEDLNAAAQSQDMDGALKIVDKTLEEGGFEPEDTQRISLYRAMIYAQQQKFDDAIKAVDEAKAIAPESEVAGHLDEFKARLEEGKKQVEAAGDADSEESKEEADSEEAAE